jgi:2-polyprenyl-3-methyl-5-hydroxy-6-metoxy-1,4-benzoquinol methylase
MTEAPVSTLSSKPRLFERPKACRVCESTQLVKSFVLDQYNLVKCQVCGTQFNETFYIDKTFRDGLFEKDYYDDVQSQAFKDRLDNYTNDPSVSVYEHYLTILEEQLGISPGNVLDVGSAFGTFLKVASNHGWKPHGVEYSQYSSSAAREHWGFEIFNGDITSSHYQNEQFDLITYWDVIEHVVDPRANLQKAFELLKDGGKLLITTDNYQSMLSAIANLAYKATIGKIRYPAQKFFIPYNTYYFTPANFRMLLKATGFAPIFFEKLDYPIDKLDVSGLEKQLVRVLYAIGDMVNMNTQFMFIAEKQNVRR